MIAMINRLPKEFRLPSGNGKHAHRAASTAAELPQRFVAKAAHCIGAYPIAALGTAFVVGLVVGRLVKR